MPGELPLAMVWTFGLLTIRLGAALRLVPFFGGAPMPVIPWFGLSVTLGALLAAQAGPHPDMTGGTTIPTRFLALAVKELFVGVIIGATVRIAFSVLEIVGQLAHISAFAVSEGEKSGVFPTAYTLLGAGIFLLIDGHHALIKGLVATTHALPPHLFPGADIFTGALLDGVIALFAGAMATGVLAAAPIFAAGLAADVIVGGVSRLYYGVAEAGAPSSAPAPASGIEGENP